QAKQAGIPVKGRVLDRLRLHRARELLKTKGRPLELFAGRTWLLSGELTGERKHGLEEVEDARLDRGMALLRERNRFEQRRDVAFGVWLIRAQIGSVDREAREHRHQRTR